MTRCCSSGGADGVHCTEKLTGPLNPCTSSRFASCGAAAVRGWLTRKPGHGDTPAAEESKVMLALESPFTTSELPCTSQQPEPKTPSAAPSETESDGPSTGISGPLP